MINSRAFWYVDGEPCKGLWVDMDAIDSTDEVLDLLVESGFCTEDYGGDLLVADAEGLAYQFISSYGCFDLDGFAECRDHKGDDDAKAAYMKNIGEWNSDNFDDAYQGEYESDEAFAEQLSDDIGMLDEVPENLRCYFDFERFARDLMMDYFEVDGYYFRSL